MFTIIQQTIKLTHIAPVNGDKLDLTEYPQLINSPRPQYPRPVAALNVFDDVLRLTANW